MSAGRPRVRDPPPRQGPVPGRHAQNLRRVSRQGRQGLIPRQAMRHRNASSLANLAHVVWLRIIETEGDLHTGALQARGILQRGPHSIEAFWQIVELIEDDRNFRRRELARHTPAFSASLDRDMQLFPLPG
jgi:hypothetical protein